MKKSVLALIAWLLVISNSQSAPHQAIQKKVHAQETIYSEAGNEFNRLNWIHVSQSSYATQLIFDFAHPIYFKKMLNPETHQLLLFFPGMRLQHFDKNQVYSKLNKLKELGFVSKIDLFENNEEYQKVVLSIDFEKKRNIKLSDGTTKKVTNSLLIKWCKMEEPYRLVFDIFTQDVLKNISQNKDAVVLQACNNNVKTLDKSLRIVLDPGHGGSAIGAENYGLKEKDLALDIALRARSILKKDGVSVLLTRNADNDISLSERTEFASQLKANLFVSIHVNSGGTAGSTPNGCETFYLNTKKLLPPDRDGGFLFVNLEKDLNYAQTIDKQIEATANSSLMLANNIQNQVVSLLHKKNIPIANRGVKSEHFRVFFNNPSPAALVEVGFITNKREARLLADAGYRQLIAQGICKGINEFLTPIKNSIVN